MKICSVLVLMTFFGLSSCYDIMPRNHLKDCNSQCKDNVNPEACLEFCKCIHLRGETLNKCLEAYEGAANDSLNNK